MDYPLRFAEQLKQHLRALRVARGLTQTRLAQLLGVGQSRIAEIEKNPGVMSMEQLFRVLAAIDVQLVLRDEHAPSTTSAETARAGDNTKRSAAKGSW
ncbi:MAG: helix-turn-helix transcriptional regulator [Rhodocyclales bacterium]|nr:helix-turn-helix transcriptional regulator [Rhodocyclales bacterium]